MQDMDVRNRVGGTRVLDEQVIDLLVLALMETDPEIRLRQSAKVVADFCILCRHVDEYGTERQFPDELVLVRFQHTHETEVFGRDLGVKVALQDGVRHLVAEDNEPAAAGTEQTFCTAFDVLDDTFVTFVKDNQDGVKSLQIRHFCHWFIGEELLQGAL